MKLVANLRDITGGVLDNNNYWYSGGKLQSSGRTIDGTADQWSGTFVGQDGRMVVSGVRNVFDPSNPSFNPQSTMASQSNSNGGKKGGGKK